MVTLCSRHASPAAVAPAALDVALSAQYAARAHRARVAVEPAPARARLFRDTEEAYQFLRARTNLKDADDRVRLAKWCADVNLHDRAIEELTLADSLRPHDPEIQRLLTRLRQPAPVAPPVTVAPPPPE